MTKYTLFKYTLFGPIVGTARYTNIYMLVDRLRNRLIRLAIVDHADHHFKFQIGNSEMQN